MSQRDVEFARRISAAARELGLESDPLQVQAVGIAVAQDAGSDVRPFWAAAFGYKHLGVEDAIEPHRRNPHLWFHPLEPPKPGRGRIHLDVSVPADQAEARVAASLTIRTCPSGGRLRPPTTTESTSRPGLTSTTTKAEPLYRFEMFATEVVPAVREPVP